MVDDAWKDTNLCVLHVCNTKVHFVHYIVILVLSNIKHVLLSIKKRASTQCLRVCWNQTGLVTVHAVPGAVDHATTRVAVLPWLHNWAVQPAAAAVPPSVGLALRLNLLWLVQEDHVWIPREGTNHLVEPGILGVGDLGPLPAGLALLLTLNGHLLADDRRLLKHPSTLQRGSCGSATATDAGGSPHVATLAVEAELRRNNHATRAKQNERNGKNQTNDRHSRNLLQKIEGLV